MLRISREHTPYCANTDRTFASPYHNKVMKMVVPKMLPARVKAHAALVVAAAAESELPSETAATG
jgi:hypothetical protein